MNQNDKKEFTKIIFVLVEAFPSAKITSAGIDAYFGAMKEYTLGQIKDAAVKTLKTRTYSNMPTIAEIISNIPKKEGNALIEVDKVITGLKQYGRSARPYFEDPITDHLMTHTWPYYKWASEVLEKDIVWFKKEFIELYNTYQGSGIDHNLIENKGFKNLIKEIGDCKVRVHNKENQE